MKCLVVLDADNKSEKGQSHSKVENKLSEMAVAQPDITLRQILLDQPYSLEQYKSLASKTALLDAAILNGDGNAILIVRT